MYSSEGVLVLDPDEQVQQTLRLLLDTFRRNEVGNVIQYSTADKFGFRRQTATLIIGKPKPTSAELLSEDSILFAQVLDGMLLLLVHPPGDRNDYEPKWI